MGQLAVFFEFGRTKVNIPVRFISILDVYKRQGLRRSNIPLRLEIASACSNKFIHMPDLLSACGFEIASARFSCREGAVLTDFVNTYVPGSPMKHLLFLSDYPWEKSLPEITFDDKICLLYTSGCQSNIFPLR